jgi:quinol monooxygenase YgiN
MLVVAGHLIVSQETRDHYLAGCVEIVERARSTRGCRDFAISADVLDPARINIFERWDTPEAVNAFRGDGPTDGQSAMIVSAAVSEYEVADERRLT